MTSYLQNVNTIKKQSSVKQTQQFNLKGKIDFDYHNQLLGGDLKMYGTFTFELDKGKSEKQGYVKVCSL